MTCGVCAYLGALYPQALKSAICLGVDGIHSSPLITCVVLIKWSSHTCAKWYVGIPSDFKRTSSIVFSGISILPLIMSSKITFLSSLPSERKRSVHGLPSARFFLISSRVRFLHFAHLPKYPRMRAPEFSCSSRIAESSSEVQKQGYASPFLTSDFATV